MDTMQKTNDGLDPTLPLQPRVLRAKEAPRYLGMSRTVFNRLVRPCVTEFPIGIQGIGFDRLELDRWLEEHMRCNGCPAINTMGAALCPREERQGSFLKTESGKLISATSTSTDDDFAKALATASRISTRRKRS